MPILAWAIVFFEENLDVLPHFALFVVYQLTIRLLNIIFLKDFQLILGKAAHRMVNDLIIILIGIFCKEIFINIFVLEIALLQLANIHFLLFLFLHDLV